MNPREIENPIAESDFRAQALKEREKAYLDNGLEELMKIKDRISVELYTTICKTDYDDGIAQGYRNILRILDKEFMKPKKQQEMKSDEQTIYEYMVCLLPTQPYSLVAFSFKIVDNGLAMHRKAQHNV